MTDEMTTQFGVGVLAKPMTKAEAYRLFDALKAVLIEHQTRLDAMELHGVKYCGVYQKALNYRRGHVVTMDGAMWTALADTPEGVAPGSNAAFWQLSGKGKPTKRVRATGRQQ
ncbi:hypothetical protein [Rhizobium sp. L43]|uniref:hypothetical protein n=1 Tax=Rhizobium sp. L43 TaxID=2035452 RepID=UPI00117A1770|nr:hypothetical protein [Rhizobium sp. L43]